MSIHKIAVIKSKSVIEIDDSKLPDNVYVEALALGLKALVNGGSTKIVKEAFKTEDEYHTAAQTKAEERVEAMYQNKLKSRGGTKSADGKIPSAVMTEARRLARMLVKETIKGRGEKISHYEASDITAAANELIAADPSLIETAKANLEARKAPTAPAEALSAIAIAPSAKRVAAEKAKKASAPLSAKQAGKVQTGMSAH